MKKMIKKWKGVALVLAVLISFGSFNNAQADSGAWENVGSAGFSADSAHVISFAFNPATNQPYVAYADVANSWKVTVMRFDGSRWVTVGLAGFSADSAFDISLAFDPATNQPYVAHTDYINSKATVMRFDGSQWVTVGLAGFSADSAYDISIAFNPATNQPYVAYKDSANSQKATVMRFDGSQWISVGVPGFSTDIASGISLAFNPATNQPYVAYGNGTDSGKATVMRFDGSQWVTVGSAGFSVAQAWSISLAFNPATNQPYVAYTDGVDSKATVMRFDGSQWVTVGLAGFSANSAWSISLAFNSVTNQPYVAYYDGAYSNKATVMRFDGSQWVTVGSAGFSVAQAWSISLAFNAATNQPYVVYADESNSWKATVMKFDSNTTDASVINISTRKSPDKVTYKAGENLDLSGLIVTLGKSDGSMQDVPFENFATYGITTTKSNGEPLVVNDTAVVTSINGHSNSISITVKLNTYIDPNVNTWNASKDNLVIITHGWNGSANDKWVQDMGLSIYNNVDHSKTSTWLFDWSQGADTGLPVVASPGYYNPSTLNLDAPMRAYNNGGGDNQTNWWHGHGERLYQQILALDKANEMPKHIHLIAHSAGSNVIQTVVDRLAEDYRNGKLNRVPSIQLTFLDAYVPYPHEQDRFGDLHGLSGYSEQYVDTRRVAIFTVFDGTHTQFKNAINFNVTSLNPKQTDFDPTGLDVHMWPIDLYIQSIANSRFLTPYSNEMFQLGFQFSTESISRLEPKRDSNDYIKGKWCVVTNVFEPYRRCLDDKPEEVRNAILVDPTREATITVPDNSSNYLVDVSQFISNGVGVLPQITINSDNTDKARVEIPAQTTVTSADVNWDGLINAPTENGIALVNAGDKTFTRVIEIGSTKAKLFFDKAVRIVLPGQADKLAGFRSVGEDNLQSIDTFCYEDSQDWANTHLGNDVDRECKMNSSNNVDLVIWTNHFTTFATYTQENSSSTITSSLTHNENTKTINYTFSEPVKFVNNDLSDIAGTIAERLAIYEASSYQNPPSDGSEPARVDGISITRASFNEASTTLTVTYDGNLVNQDDSNYVLDAWGYKIVDSSNNQVALSGSHLFSVMGTGIITPTLTAFLATPSSVNTNTETQTVTASLTISGVDNGYCNIYSARINENQSSTINHVSGDNYTCDVTLPVGSASGQWNFSLALNSNTGIENFYDVGGDIGHDILTAVPSATGFTIENMANTDGPATITNIVIKTSPSKTTYIEGQNLDLTGLIVTLTKLDSSTQDVAFADFGVNGITISKTSGSVLAKEDGEVTISSNGHSVSQIITVNSDVIAPTTTFAASGDGGPDTFKSDVQVTLSAMDNEGGSGIAKTEYSLDAGITWTTYIAPFTISGEGSHEIKFRSTDNLGNVEDAKSSVINIETIATGIDTEAPTIESLEMSPVKVNTTDSEQKVLITMHIKDNASGVGNVYLNFASPSGSNNRSAGFSFNSYDGTYTISSNSYPYEAKNALLSGVSADGVFQAELVLPKYSEAGIWKLSNISASDQNNNYSSYGSWNNFEGLNMANIVTEINNEATMFDSGAPTIDSLEISPVNVNTTDGGQKVLVTMHLRDDLTGISNTYLNFTSPSGNNNISAGFSYNQYDGTYMVSSYSYPYESKNALLSGTSIDGVFQVELTLPQYSEAGIWKLSNISVSDKINNYSNYGSWNNFEGLNMGNIVTEINNEATMFDSGAPTLESLEFLPANVDTSAGSQKVLVKMHLKDDTTGVNYANLMFISPSGSMNLMAGFYFNSFTGEYQINSNSYPYEPTNALISGSSTDGIFEAELVLPQSSEIGDWKLSSINISDKINNYRYYSQWDNFGGLSIPTSINNGSNNVVDSYPPVTEIENIQGTKGNNDWYTSNLQIKFSVSDLPASSASNIERTEYKIDSQDDWSVYGGDSLTIDQEGQHTLYYRSIDNSNNIEETKEFQFKIDKTAPQISLITPENNKTYQLNENAIADWSIVDELSGVDSVKGTVESGSPIDTNSVGTKEFVVTATDLAGNFTTNTKTFKYDVVYAFGGFQSPVTKNSKPFNGNSVIPVKFQLTDASGGYISNAITSLEVDGKNAVSSGDSNMENVFRYDESANQYIFNLSAKNTSLVTGTHNLKIKLDDGTTYNQDVVIK